MKCSLPLLVVAFVACGGSTTPTAPVLTYKGAQGVLVGHRMTAADFVDHLTSADTATFRNGFDTMTEVAAISQALRVIVPHAGTTSTGFGSQVSARSDTVYVPYRAFVIPSAGEGLTLYDSAADLQTGTLESACNSLVQGDCAVVMVDSTGVDSTDVSTTFHVYLWITDTSAEALDHHSHLMHFASPQGVAQPGDSNSQGLWTLVTPTGECPIGFDGHVATEGVCGFSAYKRVI